MRLRIAHVTNEAFGLNTANGVQHAVYSLAHAQAAIGESVAMFTRDDRATHVLSDGVQSAPQRPVSLCATSGRSLQERLLSRYFEESLARDVLAWRPDVVHFHSVHVPRNIALASHLRRAGVPYCVTIHAGLFRAALRRRRFTKAMFNLLFERRYLNEAEFVHALSPREAGVLRTHGITRPIVVAPNGLPPDADIRASRPDVLYTKHPWLRDRRVFMFIGRLDARQKGLDLLLEAFARTGLRDAALVLVGPDYRGSRDRLARLAGRLNISSHVVFHDAAFGEDRANLLAAADVFVHPSRWEGLSLSVLGAAAAAKPCVVTRDADPLGELERAQAGVIVDASIASITDGLQRAGALSRHELQAMGARARAVAKNHFRWNSSAAAIVEAYRKALAHRRCYCP